MSTAKATVVEHFPCEIREVECEFIPLSDGTRLSVRYWLPCDALEHPVPAVLEYIPYCTRDGTAARDEAMHPFFAGHGYAALRVDMRGSGESTGLLLDEYLKQEQDDALEVIAWIAAQPWCNGRVGMMGKSWGGFNSLQVATRRPPALECVIAVYFTDDRYADDIHYMGGCLLNANPGWAFTMFGHNSRPPDPALVGDKWRDMWLARLEANRPWIIEWLRHQTRDDFWKHGSVCENYADIEIPVYAMGGWADAYSNPVPRLLTGLSSPCKALIGPWGHQYMHQAAPGPMMGYPEEALRWWDRWLKDADNAIMDEPAYRVWMQDSAPPRSHHPMRPGRWVCEEGWPSDRIEHRLYGLNTDGLGTRAGPSLPLSVRSPAEAGLCATAWSSHGAGDPTEPPDQLTDDARSLCFDSEPLEDALEIFGAPRLTLKMALDQPQGLLHVRLCDLAPDGSSSRVTYGLLNLTHREGHETPQDLKPGRTCTVEVAMNDIAHRFAAGHRLRVAVASGCWPLVWPSPAITTLTVSAGESHLRLPVRAPNPEDERLAPLPPPRMSATHATSMLEPEIPHRITQERDVATGVLTVRDEDYSGRVRFDRHGLEVSKRTTCERSLLAGDPLSARTKLTGDNRFARPGQLDTRIAVSCELSADATHFHIAARLDAFEDEESVFSREWDESIPRNGV